MVRNSAIYCIKYCFNLIILPIIVLFCVISRYRNKKFDIGLGPEPLINNVYHKIALNQFGYSAETFVDSVYFITSDFDFRADLTIYHRIKILRFFFFKIYMFLRMVSRYKCIYIYFNGGPLMDHPFLKDVEHKLLKLAGVKVVVMPYGGDVYDMSICKNMLLKHAMVTDYPQSHRDKKKVNLQMPRWTNTADQVISGCDWVDYMYHWDKLTLAHFSIDVERFEKYRNSYEVNCNYTKERPFRILHAPNHKTIKGTSYIMKAIEELVNEGYYIDLVFLQKRPNHEIIEEISKADIVADQLVIGWYAMFALESMALAKPVICYLRQDLIDMYNFAGLLQSKDEIPFLNTNVFGIKQLLKDVLDGKIDLAEHSKKSLNYVTKYHSTQYIGKVFDEINRELGIIPSMGRKQNQDNEMFNY